MKNLVILFCVLIGVFHFAKTLPLGNNPGQEILITENEPIEDGSKYLFQLTNDKTVAAPVATPVAASADEAKKSPVVAEKDSQKSDADDDSGEFEIDVDQFNRGETDEDEEEFNPDEFETEPPVQLSPNLIASLAG